jgi:hypothetical protein
VVRRRVPPAAAEAPTRAQTLFEPTGEQDTEEVAVGGVREVEPEVDERDWALDDDAADYSAAV